MQKLRSAAFPALLCVIVLEVVYLVHAMTTPEPSEYTYTEAMAHRPSVARKPARTREPVVAITLPTDVTPAPAVAMQRPASPTSVAAIATAIPSVAAPVVATAAPMVATPKPVAATSVPVAASALPDSPTAKPVTTPAKDTYVDGSGFVFAGHWEHVAGIRDGRWNGTSSRSFHPGASAELTFEGRSVKIYGIVGPGGGRGIVDVDDGREQRVVSFAGNRKQPNVVIFASGLLPAGRHILRLGVVHSDKTAHDRYVNIQGAAYGT